MDREEIDNRFGYHPPRSQKRVGQHQVARNLFRNIAMSLVDLLPEGREKSTCITRLEEAMFWANAALARSPDPDAAMSKEEAMAGPRTGDELGAERMREAVVDSRLGQGEPALDRDDEERAPAGPPPHPFTPIRQPARFADPDVCFECGMGREDAIHTDPREGLDPDEQFCAVVLHPGGQCSLPAFGHIVMAGEKRRPMCEYHWREDDSGHPKERIQ